MYMYVVRVVWWVGGREGTEEGGGRVVPGGAWSMTVTFLVAQDDGWMMELGMRFNGPFAMGSLSGMRQKGGDDVPSCFLVWLVGWFDARS